MNIVLLLHCTGSSRIIYRKFKLNVSAKKYKIRNNIKNRYTKSYRSAIRQMSHPVVIPVLYEARQRDVVPAPILTTTSDIGRSPQQDAVFEKSMIQQSPDSYYSDRVYD